MTISSMERSGIVYLVTFPIRGGGGTDHDGITGDIGFRAFQPAQHCIITALAPTQHGAPRSFLFAGHDGVVGDRGCWSERKAREHSAIDARDAGGIRNGSMLESVRGAVLVDVVFA